MEFDITPLEYDLGQNIYVFMMYSIIVWIFYGTNICKRKIWTKRDISKDFFLFILYFILCLSIFTNHDFYGYWEIVKFNMLSENGHLETPYVNIIQYFNRNYLMFRISVWGGALLLFCYGAKVAKIRVYHALYLLASCFCVTFAYGRVSLAMAFCFVGYVILIQNISKNVLKSIIGLLLFLSAFYFHKSIILAMVITILMTLMPLNRRIIKFGIILSPLLIILIKYTISHIISTGTGLDEKTAMAAIQYSEAVVPKANLLGKVGDFLMFGQYYLALYILIKALFLKNNRYELASNLSINFFKISLGIIFVGTCFLFLDMQNQIFAYRILYMAMIPLVYTFVKLYDEGVITLKQNKIFFFFSVIGAYYDFLYKIYREF